MILSIFDVDFTTAGKIVDFIVQFILDVAYIGQLLASLVVNIPGYFSWLPSPIVVLLGTAFSIVVVYMILNRK